MPNHDEGNVFLTGCGGNEDQEAEPEPIKQLTYEEEADLAQKMINDKAMQLYNEVFEK